MSWLEIAQLEKDERRSRVQNELERRGLAEAPAVAKEIASLLALPVFAIATERVVNALGRAGSPRRAILALSDCVERLESSRGDASPLFIDPILDLVIDLAGSSARGARLLGSDPALAVELGAKVGLDGHTPPVDFAKACRRIAEASGEDTALFDKRLRRFRNRQMLRIALAELRDADVRDTAAQLADLASAAVQASLDHHLPLLHAEVGRPEPACAHVVMGMGKHGGRELNFSSDIDLIYFYEHDSGGAGDVSMHEFFVKLFERATASVARMTEHGMVFRVDLDLRPEGRRGPLANSLAGAERYYETWGRTWERAAWIKARPVAGDEELGERVLEMMRPFVYRRSFDRKAIEEIVAMKDKIDDAQKKASVRGLGGAALDLKLGAGGIREIEFFVQAHQLLYGGRAPELRVQNTLDALLRLEASGRVRAQTREQLADAYLLLRKIEHRVQIVEEQQTHAIPRDADARSALARSLGFVDADTMMRVLEAQMREVREIFEGLLGHAEHEEPLSADCELACDVNAPEEARLEAFARAGCLDPHAALANLETAARSPRSPFHPRAPRSAKQVALRFLDECWHSPSVDRAMRHLPDIIRSLSIHRSYLEELGRPPLARGVARVLGASDLLARYLVSSPALFSRVLLGASLPTKQALELALDRRLDNTPAADLEARLTVLRQVKQEETLTTAVADLGGVLDGPVVRERLTNLAEVLIGAALELAYDEMCERFGRPEDPGAQIAIVAGGTLGARELGYRTDVDLSAIYEGSGKTTGGTRPAITVGELYTRIVQRLLSFLSMRMATGDLYPVDTRLRPSGSQGALVISFEKFERYHERAAMLWERQALVRSRTIAGSPRLREKIDRAIEAAAYEAPVPEDAAQKIVEMRDRMRKERSSPRRRRSGERPFDLKLGVGGLVEVEFMVQYLLLAHGREHPEIRTTSTVDALAALSKAGLIGRRRATRVIGAYERLRRVQNWLRVAHDEMIDHVDLDERRLRPLALAVGYQGENAAALCVRALERDARAVHQAWSAVLG